MAAWRRQLNRRGTETDLVRVDNRLLPVADLQLGEQVLHVRLDRAYSQVQGQREFGVAGTGHQALEHIPLAFGEQLDPGAVSVRCRPRRVGRLRAATARRAA